MLETRLEPTTPLAEIVPGYAEVDTDDADAIIDADDFLTAEDIRTSLDDSFIDIAVDDDACTDDDASDAPSVNVASVESLMCFGSTMIDVLP